MVNVVFYGDRTIAKMHLNALSPFEAGFSSFKPGKRNGLDKAVKEALICVSSL